MKSFVLWITLICLLLLSFAAQANWYKGQLHMHTTKSDGNATPQEAAKDYKNAGYDFIVFTDHNISYKPSKYIKSSIDNFLVIQGMEFTYNGKNRFGRKTPVHANGIGITKTIPVTEVKYLSEMYKNIIDAIYSDHAMPLLNHPNFKAGYTAEELMDINQPYMLELGAFNSRNMAEAGAETIWDRLLSSGKKVLGAATSDTHNYNNPKNLDKGYIVCNAKDLTMESILNAIRIGDFYASTGVNIDQYIVYRSSIFISVKTNPDTTYEIEFIGKDGVILKNRIGTEALYTFKNTPEEEYVRVRVSDNKGNIAWMQPVLKNGERILLQQY